MPDIVVVVPLVVMTVDSCVRVTVIVSIKSGEVADATHLEAK